MPRLRLVSICRPSRLFARAKTLHNTLYNIDYLGGGPGGVLLAAGRSLREPGRQLMQAPRARPQKLSVAGQNILHHKPPKFLMGKQIKHLGSKPSL